ncbi:MAG: hypothetical protein ABJG41_13410 [Cyclobacteriaceae bacterium]
MSLLNMTFFDQVYNKLFTSKPTGLILHEVLKRNSSYLDEYLLWKESKVPNQLLHNIAESLRLKQDGILKKPDVHHFSSDLNNGFAITYDSSLDKTHFKFLFDLMAEKVQELGYKISVSDLMVTGKKKYVESKEKYYLKNRISDTTPIDQKYGNVIIELISIDDEPSFIRLMAQAYNDRLYKEPENFDDLAKYLLNTDTKNQ